MSFLSDYGLGGIEQYFVDRWDTAGLSDPMPNYTGGVMTPMFEKANSPAEAPIRPLPRGDANFFNNGGMPVNNGGNGGNALVAGNPIFVGFANVPGTAASLGMTGYSNGPSMAQQMFAAYQSAYNQAKQANENRYTQIYNGWDQMRNRTLGYLNAMSNQAQANIKEQYDNLGQKTQQQLIGSGLTNSTITGNMSAGVERERTRANNELSDALARERINADTQATGNLLNFMERRTDAYPDMNQMLQLAYQSGASGGMGVGGYGVTTTGPVNTGIPGSAINYGSNVHMPGAPINYGAAPQVASYSQWMPSSIGSYSDLMARPTQVGGLKPGQWGPSKIGSYSDLTARVYS